MLYGARAIILDGECSMFGSQAQSPPTVIRKPSPKKSKTVEFSEKVALADDVQYSHAAPTPPATNTPSPESSSSEPPQVVESQHRPAEVRQTRQASPPQSGTSSSTPPVTSDNVAQVQKPPSSAGESLNIS